MSSPKSSDCQPLAGEHRARLLPGVLPLALLLASIFELSLFAQETTHPLHPPDRSSPRALLETFLKSSDAVGSYLATEYRASPSRRTYSEMKSLAAVPLQCLDLEDVPPVSRFKIGSASASALYEILSRIELPSLDEIPGGAEGGGMLTNLQIWVIPNTEIVMVRIEAGVGKSGFRFSRHTVSQAEDWYFKVREMPYSRSVPIQGMYEQRILGGGWLIPYSWINSLPAFALDTSWGQANWKWAALGLAFCLFIGVLGLIVLLARRVSPAHPVLFSLSRLALPVGFLAAAPLLTELGQVQINIVGDAAGVFQVTMASLAFIAAASLAWRASRLVAEILITPPHVAPQSIDAHLIRIFSRLIGLIAAAGLLVVGADQLGIPVYGIIAGLGVGGLAIALAAQSTIENLIGSLSLFGDRPMRVGDFCRYGNDLGSVEEIGIRSTRFRGVDRTLTTIPNAVLAKMPIVNLTLRDRLLLKVILNVRQETSPDQLRSVLAGLRELLAGHPRIHAESARVRFIALTDSALQLELFAYVLTRDWLEFLAVQEELLLRVVDVVKQSGSSLAFPSQTVYISSDSGLIPTKPQSAAASEQAGAQGFNEGSRSGG